VCARACVMYTRLNSIRDLYQQQMYKNIKIISRVLTVSHDLVTDDIVWLSRETHCCLNRFVGLNVSCFFLFFFNKTERPLSELNVRLMFSNYFAQTDREF